jgi:hypothetical protein
MKVILSFFFCQFVLASSIISIINKPAGAILNNLTYVPCCVDSLTILTNLYLSFVNGLFMNVIIESVDNEKCQVRVIRYKAVCFAVHESQRKKSLKRVCGLLTNNLNQSIKNKERKETELNTRKKKQKKTLKMKEKNIPLKYKHHLKVIKRLSFVYSSCFSSFSFRVS